MADGTEMQGAIWKKGHGDPENLQLHIDKQKENVGGVEVATEEAMLRQHILIGIADRINELMVQYPSLEARRALLHVRNCLPNLVLVWAHTGDCEVKETAETEEAA